MTQEKSQPPATDAVERVARALWEHDHDDKPWETRSEQTKFRRRVQARAAIAAMPTTGGDQ